MCAAAPRRVKLCGCCSVTARCRPLRSWFVPAIAPPLDDDTTDEARTDALADALSSLQHLASRVGGSFALTIKEILERKQQQQPPILDEADVSGTCVAETLRELRLDIADDALFHHVSFPRLTTLTLGAPFVRLSTLDWVWRACPAVVHLTLLQVHMSCWVPSSPQTGVRTLCLSESFWMTAPHLIAMDPEPATLTRLVAAFPRLRRLTLPHWPYDLAALVQFAEAGALSELEALVVPAFGSKATRRDGGTRQAPAYGVSLAAQLECRFVEG